MIRWLLADDIYPLRIRRKRRLIRLCCLLVPILLATVLICLFCAGKCGRECPKEGESGRKVISDARQVPAKKQEPLLAKKDLVIIDEHAIRTRNLTIDWDLQKYIADTAVKYKLYYGSIAVLDARTGNVLALYGRTRSGEDCSLGLHTELAASVFKLVTATAAMEQAGFTSRSMFFYTGSPYTLYKSQLTNKRNKWCADISLADAFARSNNVVFGKIGSIYLGHEPLLITTKKMGFWKPPLKDCESSASTSFLPKDDYNLAELASGFNKHTRISPLHGAQMVTAVLNGGFMLTPRLVRMAGTESLPAMKSTTADDLKDMMQMTVRKGTVAKSFRGISSDRVLKHIDIGAKSGSIDGDMPKGRRNWFVGFARNRDTGDAITIGCLLILDDRFWIEADMLSRLIIRRYFSQPVKSSQPGTLATIR